MTVLRQTSRLPIGHFGIPAYAGMTVAGRGNPPNYSSLSLTRWGQSYPRGRFILRLLIPYCYCRPRRRPVQAAVG